MSSEFLDRIHKLSPQRLALLALELHEQIEAAARPEPIAIVGIGCRFPGGADTPAAFWELLREGRDAIREVPAERWDIATWFDADPEAPAKMSVRHGGFLDAVDGFDAAFFGISPREALTMDPQQRLVLEVAWEALEHAGVSPERLAGSATGVFLGICNNDHSQRVLDRGHESLDAYFASGNAHSVASGRLAYFLGLQGPALSVDTACSSSLVALHLACRSLRSGEAQMAISGGVNLMCAPQTTVALTKAHMLAPDGRCKTFDAAADGFSRGEGCGLLVLKRLADAQRDGDRVLALIRGSAINQDGRSGGLTVPNGPAQEAVMRAALADAQLAPADIGYVEAHGTGTSLGDPIEVRALAGALGPGRGADAPLVIGSVKTNIGHLESAAGIAGVIKTVLALQHEHIPPHLHFTQPSPHIAWADYPVQVAPNGKAWPRGAVPRRAGISSFGFSGTNAHAIVEEAPAAAQAAQQPLPWVCLPLSARTPQALRQLASRVADALAEGVPLAEAAHTAGVGRSHFSERLAVVAESAELACEALRAHARGEAHPALHAGSALPGQAPELVFMYTGQGSQYPGMGERLYTLAPAYRAVIDACDALLGADAAGRTLKHVLFDRDGDTIHETGWTQPALFAVEMALTALWRSWGIEPAAVIGHSVGEYIAACVAGVFPLADGLRLIAERGRLMQALPAGGSMAALFAPADEVARAVAPMAERLAIAALNAPDSVVVSGDTDAVEALLAEFAARHVQGHRLFVSLAAHSPRVEPALAAMQACAARVPMQAPHIPVAWNLTGGPLDGHTAPDAAYWRRHLREPVRFGAGIGWLHAQGLHHFLELGPHPTLGALAQRSLPEAGTFIAGSLRRGKDDWHELMHSLAGLYVRGARIDWAAVGGPQARVTLPTYPFERRSFWLTTVPTVATNTTRAPGAISRSSGPLPLAGQRLATALATFEATLTPARPAWLGEHCVHGMPLAAGPVFIELAQSAAAAAFGPLPRALADFAVHAPLVLPEAGRIVQTHFIARGDAGAAFEVHSRAVDGPGDDWLLHASGRLPDGVVAAVAPPVARPADIAARLGAAEPCTAYYARLLKLGIALGPAWQSLQLAHRRDGEVLARIELPDGLAADPVAWVHPALLDGALQAVGLALPDEGDDDTVFLLTGIAAAQLAGPLPAALWCHVRLRPASTPQPAEWRADVLLCGDDGAVFGHIGEVLLRRAARETLERTAAAPAAARLGDQLGDQLGNQLGYRLVWESAPLPAAAGLRPPSAYISGVAERFAALAREHGAAVYDELLPELDRLSAEHVVLALRSLGFVDAPGRRFHAEAEAATLGVLPAHRRLFRRLMQILAEDGVLRVQGDSFECVQRLGLPAPAARCDALLQRFAAVDGELRTLRRCGSELARVLRGDQDALQLLFPGGSFAEARQLYVESPYARTYNGALAAALAAATAELPAARRLRVLEIGGGTGGTTSFVLPLLPGGRADYTFTDLSPLFLERAAEQFGAQTFVRRAVLDIERDPMSQGFAAGHYDIVIAANVLHACADLRQAVQHVRKLLAPGGQLLLLEGLAPERWVDLSFGLTEGWWRFTDTGLRADYPLIGREVWAQLLGDLGFTDVAALPPAAAAGRRGMDQQALLVARAPRPPRRFTLAGGPAALVAALQARLHARGDAVRCEPKNAVPAEADEWVYLGALELGDELGDELGELGDELGATAAGADDAMHAERCAALAVAGPLRSLAGVAGIAAAGRAWLVTQGAQAVGGHVSEGGRWQAPLWGVGRVFALEQPGRWGGLVDLEPRAAPAALADALLAAIDADDGEDQVALRAGERLACRLVEAPLPAAAPLCLRADASYLVTGGFGGLGLQVARWLADHGARHLALLGRRPDLDSAAVRELQGRGVNVIALQGDVADAAALASLLADVARQAPPVRGMLHLAAELSAAPIGALGAAQVEAMLRPKVAGTLVLERLAQAAEMDFLVLFSSTTALLGVAGMAHYAAANAFLDASAERAPAPGRRLLSVNWGTWDAMRLASAADRQEFRQAGLEPMPSADALDALARLLASGATRGVVASADWPRLKAVHEARRPRPLLRHLGQAATPSASKQPGGPTGDAAASALAQRLAAAPASLRHDVLVDFVQHEVATVLALQAQGPVPLSTGLFDLGMDSLMAVELKRRLERGVGQPLPSTLTFNYPNIGALAAFLATLMQAAPAPTPPAPGDAAPAPAAPADERRLDDLSDDELEQRLIARLEQME